MKRQFFTRATAIRYIVMAMITGVIAGLIIGVLFFSCTTQQIHNGGPRFNPQTEQRP